MSSVRGCAEVFFSGHELVRGLKERETMTEVVDLDDIMIIPDVADAFSRLAQKVAPILVQLRIDPRNVSDEQARVNDDGSLTIFVTLPDSKGEVSMDVPSGKWARKQ